MKYRKIFAVGCLICGVLLSGCRGESQKTGQEELTAEEKNPKNGSQITIQLTEDVKLDAQIQMPETGTDSIKEYRVEVDGFDGEEVIPKILGAMPDSGLRTQESSLPDPTYLYHGPLGPEWNNTDGSVIVSSHVTVQTSHWDKIDPFISVSQIGAEVSVNEKDVSEFQEELGFSGREEAAERVSEFVKSITGYEDVRCAEEYSISYQELESRQETLKSLSESDQAKPIDLDTEEWTEADSCYWMRLEQIFHGLPVLSSRVTRQDDLYIPSSVIEAGCTEKGVEYVSALNHFREISSQEAELLPVEDIYQALRTKFERMISPPAVIDEMKLIYYPMTTGRNESGCWECDMLPVWQFRVSQEENSQYIYINAMDGIEIIG